jgi:ABC-2 type transport system permease protein
MMETLRAAFVVARRDFVAVIWSKTFIFFLIGPLFPVLVGALAGGIGAKVQRDMDNPQLGVAMADAQVDRLLGAHRELVGKMAGRVPDLVVLKRLEPGEPFDARAAMKAGNGQLAAVLTGTLAEPVLTGTQERVQGWSGMVSTLAARAREDNPVALSEVRTDFVVTSAAKVRSGQVGTAQIGQMALFLLTIMLAGMVLSNLVEEKSNKIIEVMAAAIPMDSLFLGKLFAMLGVSLVAIAVWAGAWTAMVVAGNVTLDSLPEPATGWPAFLILGFCYFAMAYLLLGSVFLTIGGMASTVREVQTLSMPVTMLQLVTFFFSTYALTQAGKPIEWAAILVPFTSPYAMLARAAMSADLWPHFLALAWQGLWVALIVRGGAHLFRRTVMKSGPARGKRKRRWFGRAAKAPPAAVVPQVR